MLGPYGHPGGHTPHLDTLAAKGVVFERAYTVTPLTIPAHSSLFTSLWPPSHGVQDNGDFYLGNDAITLAERLHDAGYATMASVGAEVTSHHWGFAQGFDAFFDDMRSGPQRARNRWRVERRGDQVIGDALGWLRDQREQPEPFFAWIHLFDAHSPYEAPEPFGTQFKARPYLGEIAYVDSLIGELVASLRADGGLTEPWIIVLADHGEGLGAHGESQHGTLLYNETTRIPMIVVPPESSEARRIDFPVSLVDIAPTLLELAGAEPLPEADGVDLGPWILGTETKAPDRRIYLESLYGWRHYGWAPQRSIVDTQFKLLDSTTSELYSIEDLGEKANLVASHTSTLNEMTQQLDTMWEQMTPVGGAKERASMSVERLAQLEALGYVTATFDEPDDAAGPLPDPVERLPVLRDVEAARQALQAGDMEGAKRRLETLVEEEPGLTEPQLMLATLLARSGEVDRALMMTDALMQRRTSASNEVLMGHLRLARGEPEQAVTVLEQAIERDPHFASAWGVYLHALLVSQSPRLLAETARGVQALPNDPVVMGMRGVALSMVGGSEAEKLLLEALDRYPSQPFCRHALGLLRHKAGRYDAAESLLLEETSLFPPAVSSRRTLVEMYAEQKRYAEQLEQLDAIGQVEPPNFLTEHSRAQVLYNLGEYGKAETAVRSCREMAPKYPACAMLIANVLKRLGRAEEAQVAYEQALKLVEESP